MDCCCLPLFGTSSKEEETIDQWSSAVWWALKLDVLHEHHSKEWKELLLRENVESQTSQFICPTSNESPTILNDTWIVQGIPKRPFYKELGRRLYFWNQKYYANGPSEVVQLFLPASRLGFKDDDRTPDSDVNAGTNRKEERRDLQFPPKSKGCVWEWMSKASEEDVLRLLGIRNTIGSVHPISKRLWIPSPEILQIAANTPHIKKKAKPKLRLTPNRVQQQNILTVAARARSKHAHRAVTEASFFGVATGSVPSQNQETVAIIQRLLDDCLWINCHNFGGVSSSGITSQEEKTDSSWVLEIRQEQGYGARWLLKMANESRCELGDESSKVFDETNQLWIQFRGFLEPQMENGHENRWRH